MIQLNDLHNLYKEHELTKNEYILYKNKCSKYFNKHRKSIIEKSDEYYSQIDSDIDSKEYLKNNKELRIKLKLKAVKEYYEEKMHSKNLFDLNFGKTVLINCDDIYYIYDYDSDNFLSLDGVNEKEIEYIKHLLNATTNFISEISEKELFLIKNIIDDIKNKDVNSSESTINEVKNEYVRAKQCRVIYYSGEEKSLQGADKRFQQSRKEFVSGDLSYDEYIINHYIHMLINPANIKYLEDLYLESNDEEKEYILEAYKRISSYEFYKDYGVHVRSTSDVINKEIYVRSLK